MAYESAEAEDAFDTVFKEEDEKLFRQEDPTTASKVSAAKRVAKSKSGSEASNRSVKQRATKM